MIHFNRRTGKIKPRLILKPMLILLILSGSKVVFPQDNIAPPPMGFDGYSAAVAHGSSLVVSYYSSTVGVNRQTRIYLPPRYTTDSTYNVLYLLHGIGGDINEWYNNGAPHYILDNLYAQDRIAPMIVVLPNGRAMVDDSPGSDIFAPDKVAGFANFEFELIKDLIPFIDTTYPVKSGREARAIAGLSMGGGQALNFGLGHLDTFAWVGAFSPAPNTKAAATLMPNLSEDTANLSALWISCGSADGLLYISENTHNFMVQHDIDHYYLVEQGKGHDWSVWKPGLYHFVQRIFGQVPKTDSPGTGIPTYDNAAFSISYHHTEQAVVFTGNTGIKSVSIFDINGRLMQSDPCVRNGRLYINHLKNGVYFVIASDGNSKFQDKIVKF